MSSILKIERKSGIRYKAVIKRGSRTLKTKTFTKQANAKSWLRRMASDLEVIDALGMKGARLTLSDLTTLYLDQWTGKDNSLSGKVQFWAEQLGSMYLPDITTDHIRVKLNDYAKGYALRWNGSRANTKPILIKTNRIRKPATINRMKACISAIFKFAIQEGYIKTNPVTGVSNKREDNKRVRYLSEGERTSLLDAARASDWDKDHLILISLNADSRIKELRCALTCCYLLAEEDKEFDEDLAEKIFDQELLHRQARKVILLAFQDWIEAHELPFEKELLEACGIELNILDDENKDELRQHDSYSDMRSILERVWKNR